MKSLVIAAALIALTVGYASYSSYSDHQFEAGFNNFITTYNKNYGSVEEYSFRLETYKYNLMKIQKLNSLNPNAHFEINQFGDFTEEETKNLMGFNGQQISTVDHIPTFGVAPVDWSSMWKKTKNQGICGASWAFSSTAVFEARHALKNLYKTVQTYYSEQELIDCAQTKESRGCSGGTIVDAYEFLNHHQFCSEDIYPFKGVDDTWKVELCKAGPNTSGRKDITAGDENAVLAELANGPITVVVDATTWIFYKSGIISDCDNQLNHIVTLTKTDGESFVQLRNSWGSSWGENGSVRLKINGNTCGYANIASVPIF